MKKETIMKIIIVILLIIIGILSVIIHKLTYVPPMDGMITEEQRNSFIQSEQYRTFPEA